MKTYGLILLLLCCVTAGAKPKPRPSPSPAEWRIVDSPPNTFTLDHPSKDPPATAAEIKAAPMGRCPVCLRNKKRSVVHSGMCVGTLVNAIEYWDEDGVYHYSDPNHATCSWWCSLGHSWSTVVR